MTQSTLCKHLKALLICTALFGIAVYLIIMPICLREMFPDSSVARAIWMGFLLVALIPCYPVLGYGWKIAHRIGQDRSFCRENAVALKRIAQIATVDTVYVFVVQTVFLMTGLSRATIAMFALAVVFIGVAITVAATALSHLVLKAAVLQEESDATI